MAQQNVELGDGRTCIIAMLSEIFSTKIFQRNQLNFLNSIFVIKSRDVLAKTPIFPKLVSKIVTPLKIACP